MPEMLSIDEFCTRCGFTRGFLKQLWKRGEGPAVVRIGARVLIHEDDARAWLEARRGPYRPRQRGGSQAAQPAAA